MTLHELNAAARGTGQRGGDWLTGAQHEAPQVGGVQAVGVLSGVDSFQDGIGVNALGQRQLDNVAGAGRVSVEAIYRLFNLGLGGGLWQLDADGGNPHLGAVGVLAGHIPHRSGILAHQDRAQPGGNTALTQGGHALGKLGLHGGGRGRAVKDPGAPSPGGPHWISPG